MKEGVVKHRNAQYDVIRELVRSESIRTQRDLVDVLKIVACLYQANRFS